MRTLLTFLLWCLLLVACWPLALLVLAVAPFILIISIPLAIVGVCFSAVFALLKALLFLPARLLGARP